MAAETLGVRNQTRKVKSLALNKIEKILEMDDEKMTKEQKSFHDQLLLKIAANVVPRTHEVSGSEDNQTPIPVSILQNVRSDQSITQNTGVEETVTHHTGRNLGGQDNRDSVDTDRPSPEGAQ